MGSVSKSYYAFLVTDPKSFTVTYFPYFDLTAYAGYNTEQNKN